MSIKIKGMDMPKSCGWCRLRTRPYRAAALCSCKAVAFANNVYPYTIGRRTGVPEWCPLVEE